jgi:hypothetical protein
MYARTRLCKELLLERDRPRSLARRKHLRLAAILGPIPAFVLLLHPLYSPLHPLRRAGQLQSVAHSLRILAPPTPEPAPTVHGVGFRLWESRIKSSARTAGRGFRGMLAGAGPIDPSLGREQFFIALVIVDSPVKEHTPEARMPTAGENRASLSGNPLTRWSLRESTAAQKCLAARSLEE